MLRCSDGSYYVGHTDELESRVAKHQAGEVEGYTSKRRPVELVWAQETATREEALAAEMRIKGWGRAKKEALIEGDWERISVLAKSRTGKNTVRPEPVEGSLRDAPRLRQAQPERAVDEREEDARERKISVRPEPVEGPVPNAERL